MSIALFVPEFWSARLRRHLDSRLVFGQPTIINRDYEGEIRGSGDTVHIQKVGEVTVKRYERNRDIDAPERPTGTTVPLTIDEEHYWNIAIDDVDAAQVNVRLLNKIAMRAGRAMAVQIDSAVAAAMIAGAGIEGGTLGASDGPVTVGNDSGDDFTLYELHVEFRRLLDNNDAPEDGRWSVIPPDLESATLLDPHFVPAGAEEQRTGKIGSMAGFDLLKTTAVPTIARTGEAERDSWGVLFGAGNYATTHADQVTKVRAYEMEKQFGDGLKGLNVWGTDIIEPETLGVACVAKA